MLLKIFKKFFICCLHPQAINRYAEIDSHIQQMNGKYDIHILKVAETFHLINLYPITDQVEKWSVFIVGNDMMYIHASLGDFDIPEIKNHNHLLNHKGPNILSYELNEFFEPIWKQTLNGAQLQFYLSVRQRLFFVNTYPFINDKKDVIGAIMFIRPFTSEKYETYEVEKRKSQESRKKSDDTHKEGHDETSIIEGPYRYKYTPESYKLSEESNRISEITDTTRDDEHPIEMTNVEP
jgi:hypothetical protein